MIIRSCSHHVREYEMRYQGTADLIARYETKGGGSRILSLLLFTSICSLHSKCINIFTSSSSEVTTLSLKESPPLKCLSNCSPEYKERHFWRITWDRSRMIFHVVFAHFATHRVQRTFLLNFNSKNQKHAWLLGSSCCALLVWNQRLAALNEGER